MLRTAAKVISVISLVVFGLMVVCIALVVAAPSLDPFPVGFAFDAGRFLAGPFDGLFPSRSVNRYVVTNWGLAAMVWLLIGQAVALLLRRVDGVTTASAR